MQPSPQKAPSALPTPAHKPLRTSIDLRSSVQKGAAGQAEEGAPARASREGAEGKEETPQRRNIGARIGGPAASGSHSTSGSPSGPARSPPGSPLPRGSKVAWGAGAGAGAGALLPLPGMPGPAGAQASMQQQQHHQQRQHQQQPQRRQPPPAARAAHGRPGYATTHMRRTTAAAMAARRMARPSVSNNVNVCAFAFETPAERRSMKGGVRRPALPPPPPSAAAYEVTANAVQPMLPPALAALESGQYPPQVRTL